jgi:hypothetical protein
MINRRLEVGDIIKSNKPLGRLKHGGSILYTKWSQAVAFNSEELEKYIFYYKVKARARRSYHLYRVASWPIVWGGSDEDYGVITILRFDEFSSIKHELESSSQEEVDVFKIS